MGIIAAKILKIEKELNDNVLQKALKQCAYINLYPIKGNAKESSDYKNVLEYLDNVYPSSGEINKDSGPEEIAANRKYIFDEIDCEYIVTVKGIYNKFVGSLEEKEGIMYNGKSFSAIEYRGKNFFGFTIRHIDE